MDFCQRINFLKNFHPLQIGILVNKNESEKLKGYQTKTLPFYDNRHKIGYQANISGCFILSRHELVQQDHVEQSREHMHRDDLLFS